MAKVREVVPPQQAPALKTEAETAKLLNVDPARDSNNLGVADMQVGSRVHRYGAWQMRMSDRPEDWPTNLDTKTERGMCALLNAVNPATLHMDENGECKIKLVAYVCHVTVAENQETGDVGEAPRTVLIDESGKTFTTRGEYAPLKIQSFLDVFPPARWASGIPIRIREHRSPRTKRTSHVIEIDLSQV